MKTNRVHENQTLAACVVFAQRNGWQDAKLLGWRSGRVADEADLQKWPCSAFGVNVGEQWNHWKPVRQGE